MLTSSFCLVIFFEIEIEVIFRKKFGSHKFIHASTVLFGWSSGASGTVAESADATHFQQFVLFL